jgi:UDP:flavonoid glycosyltransferase YjiC (YdhE family)
MARIILGTMPVPGHIAPFVPVARKLVERGHEVIWYGSTLFKDKIEATGVRFAPIKSTLDYGDSDYNRYWPERAQLKGLAQIKFDFKRLFVDAIEGQLADLREINRDFNADVIVGDPAFAAVKVMSDQDKIPYTVLNISVLGIPGRDVAPFGLGILPSYSALGHVRNRMLAFVGEKIIFRDVQKHFNAVADRLNSPRVPFRPSVSPFLYLQPSVQAFDYPRSDMPPQVHFIGPLLPEPGKRDFVKPSWWSQITNATRPVVLVTQGTIATNANELIIPALQALASENVTVVATTGGKTASELGITLPANAYVEPFIPFGELMPHVSMMITNGGYGGVTIALAHGVPVISGGVTEDKPEVNNRIAYTGVGINLKTATPTPEQIREAVKKVAGDAGYRQRARAMQAEFAKHDAPLEAVQLLERLAATKKPVI